MLYDKKRLKKHFQFILRKNYIYLRILLKKFVIYNQEEVNIFIKKYGTHWLQNVAQYLNYTKLKSDSL